MSVFISDHGTSYQLKTNTSTKRGHLYAVLALCLCSLGFTAMASANTVTGVLQSELTLREMHPSEEFLSLIDELSPTDFMLPKGTKISYTPGNTIEPYAYEDDEKPGEVISSSIFPFQQSIRIDVLPQYSDEVKAVLNKKRIFISEPQLQTLKLDTQSVSNAQSFHRCAETLIGKVQGDKELGAQVKRNFPSVLKSAIVARGKYNSKGLRDDYVAFIDYSVSSAEKRFFLVNLSSCSYSTEFVSHGSGVKGSGGTKAMLQRCATGPLGSSTRKNRTRDGFYKIAGGHTTSKFWPLIGKISGKSYKALKLVSLDGKHRDVESSGVVMHEAPAYMLNVPQVQGRSSGCPAFARGRLKNMVSRVNGSLLYIHAPQCQ